MRQPVYIVLTLLLCAAAPVSARAPEMAELWNGQEVAWRDMGTGVKESIETQKTVLIVFHATWCQVCRKFREVFKDRDIVEASRDLVMILIDVDKDPDINGAFAPDGGYVPRTVFLDPEGNVRDDLQSSNPKYRYSADVDGPAELLSLMRRAAAKSQIAPADKRAEN
jgi:thioredoxin-like negative regulator of GroEL